MTHDIIIVGAGIAGMTAAIYARRAGRTVLLIEKESIGGQITLSNRVENYPGHEAISGLDLADKLMQQVIELGAQLEVDEVKSVTKTEEGFEVVCGYSKYSSKAVICAAGLRHRRLEAADGYKGSGVSYCAVCDGAFYRGKDVAVVGGGNTAVSEAIYLADICRTVYLVHRRTGYRAEKAVMEKMLSKENIIRLENYTVGSLYGDPALEGLKLDSTVGGEEKDIKVSGLFVALGHIPQNEVFKELMELDDNGFAVSDESCKTRTPGLFVAGDCRNKKVRQLTTAAADGAVAGLAAAEYADGL